MQRQDHHIANLAQLEHTVQAPELDHVIFVQLELLLLAQVKRQTLVQHVQLANILRLGLEPVPLHVPEVRMYLEINAYLVQLDNILKVELHQFALLVQLVHTQLVVALIAVLLVVLALFRRQELAVLLVVEVLHTQLPILVLAQVTAPLERMYLETPVYCVLLESILLAPLVLNLAAHHARPIPIKLLVLQHALLREPIVLQVPTLCKLVVLRGLKITTFPVVHV